MTWSEQTNYLPNGYDTNLNKDGDTMDFDLDWWDNFWEKQRQKEVLRKQIKNELVSEAELLTLHLEHCYAVGNLSERHRTIVDQLEHNFDGQANKAIIQRFEENQTKLLQLKMIYEMLHDSLKVR